MNGESMGHLNRNQSNSAAIQPATPMGETLLLAVSRMNTLRSIISEIENKLNGPRPESVGTEKTGHIPSISESVFQLEGGLSELVDRLGNIASGL